MGIPLYVELKREPKLEVLKKALRYFKTKALLEYIRDRQYEYTLTGNKEAEKIYDIRFLKIWRIFKEMDAMPSPAYELESVLVDFIDRRKYCEGLRYYSLYDLIPELYCTKRRMSSLENIECIEECIKRVEEDYIKLKRSTFLWTEEKIAALEYAKRGIQIAVLLRDGVRELEGSGLSPKSISRIQRIVEKEKNYHYAEGIVGYLRIYLSRLLEYNVRPKEISKYYIYELKPPCDTNLEDDEWDKRNNSEAVMYLRKLIRKMKKENE